MGLRSSSTIEKMLKPNQLMLSNFHSQRSTQKQKEAPPFRVRARHFRLGFMLFLHEPTSHNDDNSDNDDDNDDADDSYSQRAQRL